MDALNRHMKSETGVECARVVERGKGLEVVCWWIWILVGITTDWWWWWWCG